ncbi:DUF4153 domain-containing protein [Weeksellaceae bacterium TAE3-ERU29]|nr:DUF4153 domain-containing protein [Weeksellaceae bacterium TAE3-ERU29]
MKIATTLNNLKNITLKYPLVLLSAISLFVYLFLQIDESSTFLAFGIIFSTAIPLFFSLKMLSKRVGKEWLLNIIGIIGLIGYYIILPKPGAEFNDSYIFIIIPIYVLVHLFVAVAPFLFKKNDEYTFWDYNKNLFINIVTSFIFSGVLTLGVLSIIYTIESLFNVRFDEKTYVRTFFFIATIGNTIIFLLFVNKDETENTQQKEFPVVLKFFTQFVLIPIMFLYTIILYLYSIKLLVIWKLPEGWLSYSILSYSIIGILALLLVYPLRNETKKSWVKWFYKIFYYSLLPLIALLFVAIFTRLLEYGFTEPRYYVLLLAIWLTVVTLYFILYKKASIEFIPKSLILFIIFSLICPYFSASSVAIRSQEYEFKKLLEEKDLLANGKIDYNADVTHETLTNLNSKIKFLNERNATEGVLPYLSKAKQIELVEENPYWLFSYEEFKNVITETPQGVDDLRLIVGLSDSVKVIPIERKSWVWEASYIIYNKNNIINIGNDKIDIILSDQDLYLTLNDSEKINFYPQIKAFTDEKLKSQRKNITLDEIKFTQNLGKYKVTVYLGSISLLSNYIDYGVKYIIFQER